MINRADRSRGNTDALVIEFEQSVKFFETREAFPGPSIYFHLRALERRREFSDVTSLIDDVLFMEYVYAVLTAWGMHRMGNQPAKLAEFNVMVDSFKEQADFIQELWDCNITDNETEVMSLVNKVWSIIFGLKVSTSETHIVAGSKALHHVLPNLVPPIDREYTASFFIGSSLQYIGEEQAFREMWPFFSEIGSKCTVQIHDSIERGGFMATGPAKVIDNAIIGFTKRHKLENLDGEAEIA
jgi:hypothetical protein